MYNGFQPDLGTTSAGLRNAAREILPIVQYLGERRLTMNVADRIRNALAVGKVRWAVVGLLFLGCTLSAR